MKAEGGWTRRGPPRWEETLGAAKTKSCGAFPPTNPRTSGPCGGGDSPKPPLQSTSAKSLRGPPGREG
eukprot:2139249-Alexandrium_andersonii.AAC.1